MVPLEGVSQRVETLRKKVVLTKFFFHFLYTKKDRPLQADKTTHSVRK